MSIGIVRYCDCDCTEPPPPPVDADIDFLCFHEFSGTTGYDTATREQLSCCSEIYGGTQLNDHYLVRTYRHTMAVVIPDESINMTGWQETTRTWNQWTGTYSDTVTTGGDSLADITDVINAHAGWTGPASTVISNTLTHQADEDVYPVDDPVTTYWSDTEDIQLSSIYTAAAFRADCQALYAARSLANLLTGWDGTTHGYTEEYAADGSIVESKTTGLALPGTSAAIGLGAFAWNPTTAQPGAFYGLEFPEEGVTDLSSCKFWGRKVQYRIAAGGFISPSAAYAHRINNALFCHSSIDSVQCSDVTTPASGFVGLECSTEGNEQLIAGTC